MDNRILLDPDNRMLGASTSDLSVYGAQTDPGTSPGAPAETDEAINPAAKGQNADAAAEVSTSAVGASMAETRLEASETPVAGSGTIQSTAAFPHIADAPVSIGPIDLAGGAVPGLPGALSFGGQAVVRPVEASAGSNALAPANDGGEAAGSPAEIGAVADMHLPGVDLAGSVIALASADVTDGRADTPSLDGLVTGTTEAATAALDDLASAVPMVTEAASPIVQDAGDAIASTLASADDALSDLAGTDPAGGVATLVSLVSVSDMFDLHTVDAPGIDAASDPALGMLDSLATDHPLTDVLLGNNHDAHDGPLDHSDFDHPLGL